MPPCKTEQNLLYFFHCTDVAGWVAGNVSGLIILKPQSVKDLLWKAYGGHGATWSNVVVIVVVVIVVVIVYMLLFFGTDIH